MRSASLFIIIAFIFNIQSGHAVIRSPATEKILLIRVDEIGIVSVGRDIISADKLARYIQERLFKSYMGTGKMHDRIILEKTDASVPGPVLEVILAEIKSGQERALRELCTQKFSKPFDAIDPKKQDRVKQKFPVLFQAINLI
jgi:hypothetical protein